MLRTPLSKQRNKHIQRVLVEAAKLAPKQSHELALVYEKAKAERKHESSHDCGGSQDGDVSARRGRAQRPFVALENFSSAVA